MKILFVGQRPWPPDTGGRTRLYYLLEAFTKRHRVTLVSAANSADHNQPDFVNACERVIEVTGDMFSERFGLWASPARRLANIFSSVLPNSVRLQWNQPSVEALRALQREGAVFDAVWADRAHYAEMARLAGFRNIVVDLADVETVSLHRRLAHSPWYLSKPLHYAELTKQRLYERSLTRRFWRTAVCKEEDRLFFQTGRESVFVVPNGVPPLPLADPALEEPGELVYVGTMNYGPNVEAVRMFHESVLPLILKEYPGARFRIVGKWPLPSVLSLHDGVRCFVHADVPDVTPYFERASVTVTPIALGSGTRLKVLEALARGKALVATSVAVEGLEIRPGIDFELAETAEDFAAACVRLLRSADERRRLGGSGRARVLERYTWDAIGEAANRALAGDPG